MPRILKEYRIKFEKVADGKKAVPNDRSLGVRSKLGGEPDWEQIEETPNCPDCDSPMSFIGQIDSIEHYENHNPHAVHWNSSDRDYMFGDVGIIYVFFCFDCLKTQSVFQCG